MRGVYFYPPVAILPLSVPLSGAQCHFRCKFQSTWRAQRVRSAVKFDLKCASPHVPGKREVVVHSADVVGAEVDVLQAPEEISSIRSIRGLIYAKRKKRKKGMQFQRVSIIVWCCGK